MVSKDVQSMPHCTGVLPIILGKEYMHERKNVFENNFKMLTGLVG